MPRLSSRLASPSGVGLPGNRPCTLRPAKTSSDQRLLTASRLSRLPQKRELEAKLYGPSGDVVKTFEDDAVIDQVPASADEKLEVTSSTHSLATGLVNGAAPAAIPPPPPPPPVLRRARSPPVPQKAKTFSATSPWLETACLSI